MATPFLQIQNTPASMTPKSPFSQLFLTKDASGAPIDVSSGYSVKSAKAAPLSDSNLAATAMDLSAVGTYTFGATGVTWAVAAASIPSTPTLHSNFALEISNDSGTTASVLALTTLTINNPGQIL